MLLKFLIIYFFVLIFRDLFLLCVCVFCVIVCMCSLYVTSACGGPKRLLGAKPGSGSFVGADSAEAPLQALLFSSPLSSRKRLWGLCVHLADWECRILQYFSSTVGKKGEKYGLVVFQYINMAFKNQIKFQI